MIFFILSTEKQSVALRKFLHAPEIDLLENLFARFFKGRRPTTLIYVSTQCIMTWFCLLSIQHIILGVVKMMVILHTQ